MIRQATVVLGATSGMAVADGYAGRGGVWSAALRGLAMEPFDASRPNIARVWDYWLGGCFS